MAFYSVHWLQLQHIHLPDPWEHVDFQVRGAFDVVGAAGWRITAPAQLQAELWIVREGSVEIILGERRAIAEAGSVVLLVAGPSRDTREVAGKDLSILGFAFSASLLGAVDFVGLLELPLVFKINLDRLTDLLTRMVEEGRERKPGYSLAIHGLGQLAFVELMRAHAAATSQEDFVTTRVQTRLQAAQNPELLGALSYVAAHYDENLDVAKLARVAHLSPKHFGRKFRAALGMTPMDYVRSFRLSRARDHLAASDEPAGRIASLCGFEDATHFSRAFKREFGLTPLEYRQQVRELARNLVPKNAPQESKPST